MPSADEEILAYIEHRFGSLDILPVEKALKELGWIITTDLNLIAPYRGVMDVPKEEVVLVTFLRDEWDFGDVIFNK